MNTEKRILTPSEKAELKVLEGHIELQKGNFDEAMKCLNESLLLEKQKRAYLLMAYIADAKSDETLRAKAKEGLKSITGAEVDLRILELSSNKIVTNPQAVLDELMQNAEVKSQYRENVDANHLAGYAALISKKYELAKKLFSAANKIKHSIKREYLIALTDIYPILNRPGAFFLKSEKDRIVLSDNFKVLEKIREKIAQYDINFQIEYWTNVLLLQLFIDEKKAKELFDTLPANIKSDDRIELIHADILSETNYRQEALQIYKQLYGKNRTKGILLKIVMKMHESKNYQDIIDYLTDIPLDGYDEEGVTISVLIESIEKIQGVDIAISKALEYEKLYNQAYSLLERLAILYFRISNIAKAKEYIQKTIDCLKLDNFPPRFVLAKEFESMGFIHYAISVIEPLREYSQKSKLFLIRLLIKTNEPASLIKAKNLLNAMIVNDDSILEASNLLGEVYVKENDLKKALEIYKSCFERNNEIWLAYNIVSIYLNLKEYTGINKYLEYLGKSDEPQCLIMAAAGYDSINEQGLFERFAIRALMKLGEGFNEVVMFYYASIHLSQNENDIKDSVTLNTIQENTAIKLTDSLNMEKWICIDGEKDLLQFNGQVFIGCTHYAVDSDVAIKLLGMSVNDELEIDGIKYKVVEILSRTTKAVRYCLDCYTKEMPDSKFLRKVEVDLNNPIASMIPYLQELKERKEFLLGQYNRNNGIGLPLSRLSEGRVDQYMDVINSLLNEPGQLYFAGDVIGGNIRNSKIVLSLSSIMFLKIIKQDSLLLSLASTSYVAPSIIGAIKTMFENVIGFNGKISGSMEIDRYGKPVFREVNKEQAQLRVKYCKDMYEIANKSTIHRVDPDFEKTLQNTELIYNIKHIISDFDYDAILAAKELGAILISDDDFVQKTARTICPGIKVTNSVSILEQLFDTNPKEYIQMINNLSKCSYFTCCNSDTLEKMISYHAKIGLIDIQIEAQLKELYSNILSTPLLFTSYLTVLLDVMINLYSKRMNARIESTIANIALSIMNSMKVYGVNQEYISNEIGKKCGLDYLKSSYIKGTFR